MRRTKDLHIGLLASIAAATLAMSGCGGRGPARTTARRCVDGNVTVVDERYCEDQNRGPVSSGGSYPYRWYSGGSAGYASPGQSVAGGSFDAPAGTSTGSSSVSSSSGSVRGVFGASAGHSAGE